MHGRDVAIADRGQGHEAEIDNICRDGEIVVQRRQTCESIRLDQSDKGIERRKDQPDAEIKQDRADDPMEGDAPAAKTARVTTTSNTMPATSQLVTSDLYPQVFWKRNEGVNNFLIYATGDVPVGIYSSTSLANLGIGHGAVDSGVGYTYLDPTTGHEFSAVAGLTYNFMNPSTDYQNGVDFHLDWGASQFLSKQLLIGAVGYLYDEIGCDSGSGDRVGCFQSRVVGVGPQIGYMFPVGNMQGYLNLKAYGEFDSAARPSGANVWLSFVLSPAMPTAPPPTKRM